MLRISYLFGSHETIRTPAIFGPIGRKSFVRGVLCGGSGGRYYADGNADAIHIVPDSPQPARTATSQKPGFTCGGEAGVANPIRRCRTAAAGRVCKALPGMVDCCTIVTADRVFLLRLGCYGQWRHRPRGRQRFESQSTEGEARDLDGLVDGENSDSKAGGARVVTTGAAAGRPLSAEPNSCGARDRGAGFARQRRNRFWRGVRNSERRSQPRSTKRSTRLPSRYREDANLSA